MTSPISIMRTSLFFLILFGLPSLTQAHVAGVTDTSVTIDQTTVYVEYTIPRDALELLVKESGSDAPEAVSTGFLIKNNERDCAANDLLQQPLDSIGSEQFFLSYECESEVDNLSLVYQIQQYLDENHENIVRFSLADRVKYFRLNAEDTQMEVPVGLILSYWAGNISEADVLNSVATEERAAAEDFEEGLAGARFYFPVGVTHILMGYDHILFLIALLLMPFRFKPLVALATSFTVAHSITLGLSVFNYVNLPVLLVEMAIAASIVYVAIENLWLLRNTNNPVEFHSPIYRRMSITFMFGLIHGFGFSYILKEMGLGDQALGALLFFNLGVEAGQFIIIALVFPMLYFMFKTAHAMLFARIGSVVVGSVGMYWLIERALS